jgi:undecaprenyl diphosphate synthase
MSSPLATVPLHVAMIMDGNRRWAKEQGLPAIEGHRAGYDTMKKVGDWCLARGVKSLTVYAFSTENWKRSEAEVNFLMSLLEHALEKELNYFIERKARLRILGRREGFSSKIVELIDKAEAVTKDFEVMTFAICLGYGGRAEIVDAVREIAREGIAPDAIDEDTIGKRLYWSHMPDPDLIIRTSGEERLSGFLLWQSAYSELYWIKKNWPALEEKDIDEAFAEYASRQRRYGK